jgi:hypothetical protein
MQAVWNSNGNTKISSHHNAKHHTPGGSIFLFLSPFRDKMASEYPECEPKCDCECDRECDPKYDPNFESDTIIREDGEEEVIEEAILVVLAGKGRESQLYYTELFIINIYTNIVIYSYPVNLDFTPSHSKYRRRMLANCLNSVPDIGRIEANSSWLRRNLYALAYWLRTQSK